MPEIPDEVLIARWQEPAADRSLPSRRFYWQVILGTVIIALILVGTGYLAHDWSFYLGAGVAALAGITYIFQRRSPVRSMTITLTNQRLGLDDKAYSLADLAGFWPQKEGNYTVINLERRNKSFLPIAVRYPSNNAAEPRQLFLQVLAEVEPRPNVWSDSLGRFMK
ncbi:hypothetical protein KGQ71_03720 [Patescibacteria group bacterium]|nr:hypothetical protein [Patescibacteria group bacterium]